MPRIEPQDESLKALTGIHLWHAPFSSCSQRVRIVLAEMEQEFTSHVVDLERGEHATVAYQRIHPKGVVPALVDDGELFIESIDIIDHVARQSNDLTKGVNPEVLQRADNAQLDLKLLTFEFLFRGAPSVSDEEAQAFQRNHQNEWLKQFYRDFAAGFEVDRVDRAVRDTRADFAYLDNILSDRRTYLSGETFSLADIAWLPNVHRFDIMGWPFDLTPNLKRWFDVVSQRASYKSALVDWENPSAKDMFRSYTEKRRAEQTDIRTFGGLTATASPLEE